MIFKNILVPYDESEHAVSALHIALGMVGDDPSATVHVVTVVSTGVFGTPSLTGSAFGDSDGPEIPSELEDVMDTILARTRDDMKGVIADALDGAQCSIVPGAVIATSPVEGIADYVADNGIDLVVMGRRGLGALRGMLGSVSYGVLRSIEVPVLTVK